MKTKKGIWWWAGVIGSLLIITATIRQYIKENNTYQTPDWLKGVQLPSHIDYADSSTRVEYTPSSTIQTYADGCSRLMLFANDKDSTKKYLIQIPQQFTPDISKLNINDRNYLEGISRLTYRLLLHENNDIGKYYILYSKNTLLRNNFRATISDSTCQLLHELMNKLNDTISCNQISNSLTYTVIDMYNHYNPSGVDITKYNSVMSLTSQQLRDRGKQIFEAIFKEQL